MKKRFRDVIDIVDYEDLLKIKNDIDNGGLHLKKLVDEKIKEQQRKHNELCSVCSNEIDPSSTNSYTLVFGPDDFRKKATFCAVDCLEYFINNLKKIKEVR